MENEKTDLGLELSFVRDKLQQKTATADSLEMELLELGAKLDKSTHDYVRPAHPSRFCTCTIICVVTRNAHNLLRQPPLCCGDHVAWKCR